jgi:hypothetical protein
MLARLCTERDNFYLKEACVYLYRMLGWYEEAVDLALNVNVELAREVANSVHTNDNEFVSNLSTMAGVSSHDYAHSDELKKMLWLRIARHVIEKENDVNKAMQFLHDLSDSIAIEDVLPYFPDFVTIDQFKDSIRSSLAAYTDKIHSLKENIDQAAASAQLIRADIQNIRQKSITVNSSDSCSQCKFRLMTRRFYVFPCSHKFHGDCLYLISKSFMLASKQRRIEEIHRLLQDVQLVNTIQPLSSIGANNQTTTSLVGTVTNAISNFSSKTTATAAAAAITTATISSQKLLPAQQQQQQQQQISYSNEEVISLKTELDELLAAECPWCGERILKTIDEPFLDPLKYEQIFNSWL